MQKQKRYYFDHAASTPLDPRVREIMAAYEQEEYGNPGGLYREGRRAKNAVDTARKITAEIFHALPDEIVFTSGGTEGDMLALFGIARAYKDKGRHIITTTIEHHAVLHACDALEKEGFEITRISVTADGIVDPQKIQAALRPDTILVSVMYANNEIGTIQPIEDIARAIGEYRKAQKTAYPFFHTDACQASGYLDLDVTRLGVDCMVVNGSKIYGPKGVGALYIKKGVNIQPMMYGGSQEGRRRSGTENVSGIVGFAEALRLADSIKASERKRVSDLRDFLLASIQRKITRAVLNGDLIRRLPNNINISILDIEGEAVVLYLDEKGIACSTGSACTSESLDPSHVILALGRPYEYAHASIRFTLGRRTSKSDINYLIKVLPDVVATLRKISPIHIDEDATAMSHPEAFAGEQLRVKAQSKSYK